MKPITRRIVPLFAVLSLTLAACGTDDTSSETTVAAETAAVETTAETSAPVETTAAETVAATEAPVETTAAAAAETVAAATEVANEVDVRFSQGGLGHHAQAVELAEIALDPKAGARPEILELGKAITAPSPEFDAIEGLLTKWGKPLELSKEEMAKMDGMATPDTVEKLATLTGAEFDTAFLSTLVKHHEGAIKMAEKAIAEGQNAELRPIAEKLLQMRTTELVSIKALLG